MTLPEQVFGLQEIGDEAPYYWAPSSPDGNQVLLEPGESVQLIGKCRVKSAAEKWSLPDDTTVVFTDRRMVFITREFDTGGGWIGLGAVGLSISLAANAVSRQRAAKRSAGLVAIGQVRHEWIESVEFRRHKVRMFPEDIYVDITTRTTGGSVDVELWGPGVVDDKLAKWLVSLVVWHRSLLAVHMPVSDRVELDRLQSTLAPDRPLGAKAGMTWHLPGHVEHLIAAVAPRPPGATSPVGPPRPLQPPTAGAPETDG